MPDTSRQEVPALRILFRLRGLSPRESRVLTTGTGKEPVVSKITVTRLKVSRPGKVGTSKNSSFCIVREAVKTAIRSN